MPTEQNKRVVRRFFDEMCNAQKLNIAAELFSPDHVYHDPQTPADPGPDGMKQVVSTYQTSFPDARWNILDMLDAENNTVVTHWVGRGRNDVGLMGMPATGKQVNVEGIWMHRISNGRIVESWNIWDTLGMLQQMDLVPRIGSAKVTAEKRN